MSTSVAAFVGSRRGRCAVAAIWGSAGFAAAAWCFDEKLSLSGDNTEFVILARSLAQGEGLHYVNDPDLKPATKYPFGFPLMLSPLAWLSGSGPEEETGGGEPVRDFISMKWLVAVLFAGVPAAVYLLARDCLGEVSAWAAALLCALQPKLVEYGSQVMSEIPYTLFSLATLFLVQRGARCREGLTNPWLTAGFVCLMWSYYVRSAGVVLVAAVLLFLAFDRQYRRAIVLVAGAVVTAFPWWLRNHFSGRGGVYVTQFLQVNPYHPDRGYLDAAGFLERFGGNLQAYLVHIMPKTLWPSFSGAQSVFNPVTLAIVAVALWASFLCIRRRENLLIWIYGVLFLGLMFLWPWVGDRFLLPAIPVLLFFAVRVGGDLLARLGAVGGKPVCAVLGVTALLLLLNSQVDGLQSQARYARGPYQPGWQRYYDAGMWIRNNLPPESVISCRKGFWMHVVSGRRTIGYKFKDPDTVLAGLRSRGADFVVVDQLPFPSTARYLVPAIGKYPDLFRIVWHGKNPDTYVLEFQG